MWEVLSEFHTLLRSMAGITLEPSQPGLVGDHLTLTSTLQHAGHLIMIKSLVHRWCSQSVRPDWLWPVRQLYDNHRGAPILHTNFWETNSEIGRINDDGDMNTDDDISNLRPESSVMSKARRLERFIDAANDILSILRMVGKATLWTLLGHQMNQLLTSITS